MRFVCSLCFAGVQNDAIPMCAYGVVLYWEHGERAHIMSESGNHLRYVRNITTVTHEIIKSLSVVV